MGKKEKFSYFDLFEKQAAAAVLEAELLLEVIDNYGSKDAVADAMERAHTLENESDKYAPPSTSALRTTSSRPSSATTSSS